MDTTVTQGTASSAEGVDRMDDHRRRSSPLSSTLLDTTALSAAASSPFSHQAPSYSSWV